MSRPPARKPLAFRLPSLYPAVRYFVPLRFCRRILICPPGGTHGGKNPPHGAACETGPAPKGQGRFRAPAKRGGPGLFPGKMVPQFPLNFQIIFRRGVYAAENPSREAE